MAVALTPGQPPAATEDMPRVIVAPVAFGDKIFRGILRAAGFTVFLITGLILIFLAFRAASALRAMGFGFFTTSTWFISTNQFGIAAILPLGILAALFALVIAVPVGIATAVFISEYAPAQAAPRPHRPDGPHGRGAQHHRRAVRGVLPDAPDPRLSTPG